MKEIIIVGAGASGLTAAICAAEHARVTVLEKQAKAGKKLLATGNGHCNFLNEDTSVSHFHSRDIPAAEKLLGSVSRQEILLFFRSLGILPKSRNGYLYPLSGQAVSIQRALYEAARQRNVAFHFEETVLEIRKEKERFTVRTGSGEYTADAVLLAAGSKAGMRMRDYGGGYELAAGLGHRIYPVLPALVQLRMDAVICRYWAGIRKEAEVSLYIEDTCVKQDRGELLLTDYGISGIVVFQVSSDAAIALADGKQVSVLLNFLPELDGHGLWSFLDELSAAQPAFSLIRMLEGLLPEKLAQSLVMEACKRYAGLFSVRADELYWQALRPLQKERILRMIQAFDCPITGTNGFEQAQVCSGGVPLSEIESDTCESRLVRGLYLTGELLDVNGDCGGYNLHWAWATGLLAGRSIGKD